MGTKSRSIARDTPVVRIKLNKQIITTIFWILGILPAVLMAETQGSSPVWAEVSVSEPTPYMQQTIVYTITVKSAEQLKNIAIEPPIIQGVAPLQKIDEVKGSYRTEFRYALTSLTIGSIKIPSVPIDVIYAVNSPPWGPPQYGYDPQVNKPIEVKIHTEELTLNVRPPASTQQLWLPLTGLNLQGQVDKTKVSKVGEPITVTLTLNAEGVSGEQLPTPVLPVAEKDFQVYSERPQTNDRLSNDKKTLIGQRIEKYTVIPQREGRLELPTVRLHWWDVKEDRERIVEWLGPVVQVGNITSSAPVAVDTESTEKIQENPINTSLIQMASFIIVSLLIGWWLGAGRPGKSQLQYLLGTLLITGRRGLHRFWMGAKDWARQTFQFKRKMPFADLLLETAAKQPPKKQRVPKRLRAFNLIHAIDTANNPTQYLLYIQQFANEFLRLPPFASLPHIAETLTTAYPHLNATDVRRLFKTLDDALYSGVYNFNPETWKTEFKNLFRTLPFYSPRWLKPEEIQSLPPLNPFKSSL